LKAYDTLADAPAQAVRTDTPYYSERRTGAAVYVSPIGFSGMSNNAPVYSSPSPSNGATDVPISTSLLSLTIEDPDGDSFDWSIETSPNIGSSSGNAASNGSKSCSISNLEYSAMYHWFVNSTDGESSTKEIYLFTTEESPNNPPYVPSDPSPFDGEINVEVNVDLSWVGGDPDPGDTVDYVVYFGTDPYPPIVEYSQEETTYDPGVLEYGTTYFWKIVSWDNHADYSVGPIWSFTTVDEPNNPSVVSDEVPSNRSIDVYRNTLDISIDVEDLDSDLMDVFFSWKNHDDEWVILTTYYQVGNGVYHVTNLTGDDWKWGNTIYYWGIKVNDGICWTNVTYHFTTSGSRYDVNSNDIVNFQDAGLVWIHRTSEFPYAGIYDVNQDGKVNFQDAGLIWINMD